MKNGFELLGSYIGLFLILILLASSCATESWDFIGTWNLHPDKLPGQKIPLAWFY